MSWFKDTEDFSKQFMEHAGFALTSFKIFELAYISNFMCVFKNTEFSIMPVW